MSLLRNKFLLIINDIILLYYNNCIYFNINLSKLHQKYKRNKTPRIANLRLFLKISSLEYFT